MKKRRNIEMSWERLLKARGILTGITLGSGASLVPFSSRLRMAFTPVWFLLVGIFLASSVSVMVLNRFVD